MITRPSIAGFTAVVACAFLVAACAAGAGSTTVPVAPTPLVTPEVATATPAPSPTAAPPALASSPQPSPVYGDSSTAVAIHIESPECVTKPEEAGTTDVVNGVRQMRGWARHCRYDAADPRFSGWSDILVNSDCYLADYSRCVRWGTERIPGPDGDWAGSFWGGQLDRGIRFNYEVMVGTGAYAGWSYVSYMNMAALGGEEWVIDGFIYQGPPPPVPEVPTQQDPMYDGSTAVDVHLQEGDPPDWACDMDQNRPPKWTTENGVQHIREAGRTCRYDGADPRFSGWSYVVHNADIYAPGEDRSKVVFWGTERIPGPDGDWSGPYLGGSIGAGSGFRGSFGFLEGTGAYEGWTFLKYFDQAALGGEEWVVDGFVFHGPPPPVPPLPSPSSE
jgi:hypothetical protein